MKLQEATDHKVMNLKECFDFLEWEYTEENEVFNDIKCSCGGELEFTGFFDTECIKCSSCKKHMIDLFSPIQTSNSTCTILNPKDFEPIEENRHWIAIK